MTSATGKDLAPDRAAVPRPGERLSEADFLTLVLDDPDGKWELIDGAPRGKPAMSWDHNDVMAYLGAQLIHQLARARYRVRIDAGHLRTAAANYLIPDIAVIPTHLGESFAGRADVAEVFSTALPLVVEVWSRSTGQYEVNHKLPMYRDRGDAEIWLVHPYRRTVNAWRRQPDGSYAETVYHGGTVPVDSLPGVTIDLDALWS